MAQTDSDSLVLAYAFDDGDSGIELMDAQALPFSSPNRSQLWSGTPSGWGLVVETLALQPGSVLDFVGTYIYDSQGTARWVTGSTNNVTTGGFSLAAYRVHCPACPWFSDWAASPLAAGSMTRTYTGASTGTMSTTITLRAPMTHWNRNNVPYCIRCNHPRLRDNVNRRRAWPGTAALPAAIGCGDSIVVGTGTLCRCAALPRRDPNSEESACGRDRIDLRATLTPNRGGRRDAERPLSAAGRSRAAAAAQWLTAHGAPERVICSPVTPCARHRTAVSWRTPA